MEQQEWEDVGLVRQWYREQGWGIVEVPRDPWDCFVHFSHIEQASGYRELTVGEHVTITWVRQHKDEFEAVATQVIREPPA
jgi:cold shock protein